MTQHQYFSREPNLSVLKMSTWYHRFNCCLKTSDIRTDEEEKEGTEQGFSPYFPPRCSDCGFDEMIKAIAFRLWKVE